MAGSAVIGALRVNLGIDSADFDRGLKSATVKLGLIGGAAIAAGQMLGDALGRAIRNVATAIPNMINQFDDLSKLSQKIGVPIDDLSRLKYAADLSGVSLDGLSTAFSILSRNMSKSASNAGGHAADAFTQLGVSVKNADGTLRSSTDVFNDVVTKFSGMEDGAQKTALAMQIFGKSGKDLIPLLNSGADGLAALTAEADKFGLTIDANTGKAAEAFNDNLTRLGAIFQGLITKVTAAMLPTFQTLSEAFVAVAKNADTLDFGVSILTTTLKALVTGGIIVGEVFKTIGKTVAAVGTAIGLTAKGEYSTAFEVLKAGVKEVDANFTASADLIKKVWTDSVDSVLSIPVHKISPVIVDQQAAKDFEDTQKRLMEEGKQVFEATRTPAEQLALQFQHLNELLAAGAIDWDTYQRAVKQAQDEFDPMAQAAKQAGETIENAFTSAFDSLIDGTFNAQDAIRSLLKDLLKLAVNSAFKSLAGSFGSLFGGSIFGGGSLPLGMGGIGHNAQGTDNWSGGPTWVGEDGPEIVDLPRGTRVTPNTGPTINVAFNGITDMASFQKSRAQITTTIARAAAGAGRYR